MKENILNPSLNGLPVSEMAETLIGSEIIRLAGEINDKIKSGDQIYNLTIGDFDPKIFPIPQELEYEVIRAYYERQTNYPPANGLLELRQTVSDFYKQKQGLVYSPDEILIAGGARPLIYALYQTIADRNDFIIFPVPSWNNNHYTHLSHAEPIQIYTKPENNFMPKAQDIKPHIKKAFLISLCSPLNPSGTVFKKDDLAEICELVIKENKKRSGKKPVYVLYDQIYWLLAYGDIDHFDPVSLYPEMRDYTIYIDGISKAFAATGLRVGWSFGPQKVIDKMKAILSHIGAWAPKAEQVAVYKYLKMPGKADDFITYFRHEINLRQERFYEGFTALKSDGMKVDVIEPQAAIYLTVKFDLKGMKKKNGEILNTTKDITDYILNEAKVAIVPFYAFGDSEDSAWYRISVGTCRTKEIPLIMSNLRAALLKLK